MSTPRWARTVVRIVAASLLACAAVLPIARKLGVDRGLPHGLGLALRKDTAPDDGDADGDVETLATLVNTHTGEVMVLSASEPTLARFSEALEDRVTGARIELDPRLLGLLRRIARRAPGGRIELVSGFRSPKLNEMLRKKGHNVASHSQHSLGRAVDFRLVGMRPKQMKKEILASAWEGGIGEYDKRSDDFVHTSG